jgi:hypothetical protein
MKNEKRRSAKPRGRKAALAKAFFFIFHFSFFILCSSSLSAAAVGGVSGRVVDVGGRPVDGVKVTASDGVVSISTIATAGWFLLSDLPPGLYGLTFEREGAGTVVWEEISIEPGRIAMVRITLPESEDDILTLSQETPMIDPGAIANGLSWSIDELRILPVSEPLDSLSRLTGLLHGSVRGSDAAGHLWIAGTPVAASVVPAVIHPEVFESVAAWSADATLRSSTDAPLFDLTLRAPRDSERGSLHALLAPEGWTDDVGFAELALFLGNEWISERMWGSASHAVRDGESDGRQSSGRMRLAATPSLSVDGALLFVEDDVDLSHGGVNVRLQRASTSLLAALSRSDSQNDLNRIATEVRHWRGGAVSHEFLAGGAALDDGDGAAEAYVSDTVRWNRWIVLAGVRYDDRQRSEFLPRFQVSYVIDHRTNVRAAANDYLADEEGRVRELLVSAERSILDEFVIELALSRRRFDGCRSVCEAETDAAQLFATKRLSNRWMMQAHAAIASTDPREERHPEWSWGVSGGVELPWSLHVGVVAASTELEEDQRLRTIDLRLTRSFPLDKVGLETWLDVLTGDRRQQPEETHSVRVGARVSF